MRKQFNLQDWLKDKNQKVETRSGFPAKILHCDGYGESPILVAVDLGDGCGVQTRLYFADGKLYKEESDADLFIVTPEPELSEFEERIFKLLRQYKECDIPLTPENIKAEASMLWSDFEKYFFDLYGKDGESDSVLRRFYYRGLADGKAEALKEIEQDPESSYAFKRGVEYGKEEALKDLPRWNSNPKSSMIDEAYVIGQWLYYKEHRIRISDIEKLPGFKEDESHE